MHQKGLLYTDMPDSSASLTLKSGEHAGHVIKVGHEILELKKYNGEICQGGIDYQLDKCRHEYIEKVSFFKSIHIDMHDISEIIYLGTSSNFRMYISTWNQH